MKLLSVSLARSVWVGQLRDFNPKGIQLYPLLFPYFLDKYKFKKYPSLNDVLDETKGIVFEGGDFLNNNGDLIDIRLTLFNFGFMAETVSSTVNTDAFLETLLTQLHDDFNLPHYSNVIKKQDYLSQVYVSSEKTLELFNPKLKTISEYMENNVTIHGIENYELSSIQFWANPVKSITPFPFTFERAASVPFSEKRYFSSCPLTTEKHLEILDKLEDILGS